MRFMKAISRCPLATLFAALLGGCSLFDSTAPAPFGTTYDFGFASTANYTLSQTELYMDRHGQRVHISGAGFVGTRSDGPTGSETGTRLVFWKWSDPREN
jgi:hypothetical protein